MIQQVLGYFSAYAFQFHSCIGRFSCVAQAHNKLISYKKSLISGEPASLAVGLCWTLRETFLQFVVDANLSTTEV